jgi:hypothetical protein
MKIGGVSEDRSAPRIEAITVRNDKEKDEKSSREEELD